MNETNTKPKVTIYGTTQCPYCQLAKNFLKENHIEYTEKNVENEEVLQELIKKTDSMTVPIIEINDNIIEGFNPEEIKKALGIK